MKKLAQTQQKGFTLIELLIVIVIIGILAGIVITILNPARQQARARDGVIVATMNKMIADIRANAAADISGVGSLPSCATLVGSLQNIASSSCPSVDRALLTFNGVTIGTVAPGGGDLSNFEYVRSTLAGSAQFCISAPANDTSSTNNYIIYDMSAVPASTTPARSSTNCPNTIST